MMVDMQEGYLVLKGSPLRMEMLRSRLGTEMYKEFFELRPLKGMQQTLLAKKDEAEIILTNEQNDFLFADASEIKELEDLSANRCMMARIQQVDSDSEDGTR
nr:hypothetical protein [Tanacetum cinerariifolium]